jgi:branched-chain amino acid transport system permease protein
MLHIINFAHGAALMMALYGVYYLHQKAGIDRYLCGRSIPSSCSAAWAAYLGI